MRQSLTSFEVVANVVDYDIEIIMVQGRGEGRGREEMDGGW
jgi:hypothetical protein